MSTTAVRGIEFAFLALLAVLVCAVTVFLHALEGTKPARVVVQGGAAFAGTILLGLAVLSFFHT